jgi:hypothetical protein
MSTALIIGLVAVGIIGVVAVINLIARSRGYSIPGKTIVCCSKGHLFSTTWIEGSSLKAIKLGPRTRYQRCPVGSHWTTVHPVKDEDLTDEERLVIAKKVEG